MDVDGRRKGSQKDLAAVVELKGQMMENCRSPDCSLLCPEMAMLCHFEILALELRVTKIFNNKYLSFAMRILHVHTIK